MVLVLLCKTQSKIIDPTATEHDSGVTDLEMENLRGRGKSLVIEILRFYTQRQRVFLYDYATTKIFRMSTVTTNMFFKGGYRLLGFYGHRNVYIETLRSKTTAMNLLCKFITTAKKSTCKRTYMQTMQTY